MNEKGTYPFLLSFPEKCPFLNTLASDFATVTNYFTENKQAFDLLNISLNPCISVRSSCLKSNLKDLLPEIDSFPITRPSKQARLSFAHKS